MPCLDQNDFYRVSEKSPVTQHCCHLPHSLGFLLPSCHRKHLAFATVVKPCCTVQYQAIHNISDYEINSYKSNYLHYSFFFLLRATVEDSRKTVEDSSKTVEDSRGQSKDSIGQ